MVIHGRMLNNDIAQDQKGIPISYFSKKKYVSQTSKTDLDNSQIWLINLPYPLPWN